MGDSKTCVYQFICNEKDSVDKDIKQYLIMHGLWLCIQVDSYVAHMFYAWLFSHNTEVPIAINKKNFLSLNTHSTAFACGDGNSKNIKVTIRSIIMA